MSGESVVTADRRRVGRRLGITAGVVFLVGLSLAVSGMLRSASAGDDLDAARAALRAEGPRAVDLTARLDDRSEQLNSATGERRRLSNSIAEVEVAASQLAASVRAGLGIQRGMVDAIRRADPTAYNELNAQLTSARARIDQRARDYGLADISVSSIILVLEEVTRDVG